MYYYQDISLMPGPEISLYFIWEKIYQQLHLGLVELQDTNGCVGVGVDFPEYRKDQPSLGSKLRLLTPQGNALEALDIEQWLSRLRDYAHVTGIREAPRQIEKYAYFRRVQPKSSNTRLARRKAKREGISYEAALSRLMARQEQFSNMPYVHIKSLSSGKRYRLIINRTETDTPSQHHCFSTYGLASTSTVPVF